MIIAVNNMEVKTIHAVQLEEVESVYYFDIEFSDSENKYHHVTSDYMDDIIAVSSSGTVLQFEFVGLEKVYSGKVVARHNIYINGIKIGIA